MPIPKLHYSIRRDYPWPFFTPLMACLVVMGLVILIPINVALTGYQIIVTQTSDFNTIGPRYWYHAFVSMPKPGSLCQSHNFTIGDAMTTDYSLMKWSLVSTNTSDPLRPYVPYSGQNLDNCDIFGITIELNAETYTVNVDAAVRCLGSDFPILMYTTTTAWGGSAGSYDINVLRLNIHNILDLPANEVADGLSFSQLSGVAVVNDVIKTASVNLLDQVVGTVNNNATAPYAFTATAISNFCPKTLIAQGTGNCTQDSTFRFSAYSLNLSPVVSRQQNGTLGFYWTNTDFLQWETPINNLVQVIIAAARLDIGHVLPNNVLTNASMIDTIVVPLPIKYDFNSYDLNELLHNNTLSGYDYPVPPTNTSYINAAFSCQLTYPKGWAETLLAVLVATVSMFGTGWAIAMTVATWFVMKHPAANHCETHAAYKPTRQTSPGPQSEFVQHTKFDPDST